MNFVFVSYNYNANCTSPDDWVTRIQFYVGSIAYLSKSHTVHRVEQINYEGKRQYNGVQYHFINLKNKSTRFPQELHRLVKNLKPDVVVVHGLHYPLQVMQLRLQLNRRIKIIAQNHAEKPAVGIRKLLQRVADKCIDAYWFSSRDIGIHWINRGNLASAGKIYEVMEVSSTFYPIDQARAKGRTGLTGDPAFLWVGRLNDNKDPLNVVKAFLTFVKVHPSAKLYMIYQTEELLDAVIAILDKPDISRDAVTLVGKVPHAELLYWYNSADFIVSGSFYESGGTAVCEAMSCGCIPVLTDISSFRMMADNGNCGLLYEPGNEAALLSALHKTREMNIQEGKKQALEFFNSNLSFQAIAQRMERIAASL